MHKKHTHFIKVLVTCFVILLAGVSQKSWAQEASLFSNVRSALKASSAKELAKHFNETIEININGEKDNYSSAHAEIYLKDFFKKYPSVDFEYVHQGSSKDGLKYAIGNYIYSDGSFRIILRVKKIEGKERIYVLDLYKE
jgi:hypothetical protein